MLPPPIFSPAIALSSLLTALLPPPLTPPSSSRKFSYVASEVMSADAFAAFEEAGIDDDKATARVGKLFADTVLSMGGSRDASRVFRDFRGRDPKPDALLRHRGLDATDS